MAKPAPRKVKSTYDTNMWRVSQRSLRTLVRYNRSAALQCLVLFYALMVWPLFLLGKYGQHNPTESWIFVVGIWGITSFANLLALVIALASMKKRSLSFWSALNQAAEHFLQYLGYLIVYGVLIALGLFGFVFPGILFAFWYCLIFIILLEDGQSIGASFVRSRQLVRGRLFEYLAITLISLFLSLGGLLGPSVSATLLSGWYEQLAAARQTSEDLPLVANSTFLTVAVLGGGLIWLAVLLR